MPRIKNVEGATVADRLRRLMEIRNDIIKALAPGRGDYVMGGGHRMWVMDSAERTALEYIDEWKARSAQIERLKSRTGQNNLICRVLAVLSLPMPPDWNGVRPAHFDTEWGNTASTFKDNLHFTNTLRYTFATKGFAMDYEVSADNKVVLIQASPMLLVAQIGFLELDKNMLTDTPTPPTVSPLGWDAFIQNCIEQYGELTEETQPDTPMDGVIEMISSVASGNANNITPPITTTSNATSDEDASVPTTSSDEDTEKSEDPC